MSKNKGWDNIERLFIESINKVLNIGVQNGRTAISSVLGLGIGFFLILILNSIHK